MNTYKHFTLNVTQGGDVSTVLLLLRKVSGRRLHNLQAGLCSEANVCNCLDVTLSELCLERQYFMGVWKLY